jgi:hypothetical protein
LSSDGGSDSWNPNLIVTAYEFKLIKTEREHEGEAFARVLW